VSTLNAVCPVWWSVVLINKHNMLVTMDTTINVKMNNKTRLPTYTPRLPMTAHTNVARLATKVSTQLPGGFQGTMLNVSWIPV
jgi:hypothetical protein